MFPAHTGGIILVMGLSTLVVYMCCFFVRFGIPFNVKNPRSKTNGTLVLIIIVDNSAAKAAAEAAEAAKPATSRVSHTGISHTFNTKAPTTSTCRRTDLR